MSILETNTIDMVATRPDSNTVKLVVTDHLTWDDVSGHSQLLQEKINTYITFVESGQLARMTEPRVPASPEVVIAVVAKHQPSDEARAFLTRVEEFLAGIGIDFELEVREKS